MSDELKRYNHLNYGEKKDQSPEKQSFIDFLYSNSEISFPESDEMQAWDRLTQKIAERKHRKGTYWLKIAASITILCGLAIAVFLIPSNPDQIQVASTDENITVTFPDGSIGILNQNSQFTYPEYFGMERRVSFSGEAYFDIQKSEKPFIINANGVDVKVLGTAFNLITSENEVALYVDRGLVAFSKNGIETKVSRGQEAIFDKSTNEVAIKENPSNNIMSWRNGTFKFKNTPLGDALNELSDYYQVDFKLSNQDLTNCTISVTINNQSLSEALDVIEEILEVNAKVKGKTVKISGKGC